MIYLIWYTGDVVGLFRLYSDPVGIVGIDK
jgi:hypothetical protein